VGRGMGIDLLVRVLLAHLVPFTAALAFGVARSVSPTYGGQWW
jgi:hypothetical protein